MGEVPALMATEVRRRWPWMIWKWRWAFWAIAGLNVGAAVGGTWRGNWDCVLYMLAVAILFWSLPRYAWRGFRDGVECGLVMAALTVQAAAGRGGDGDDR